MVWAQLAWCWLLAVGCSLAQQQREIVVITGQQLADEVAAWGRDGGNVVLRLGVPYLSMQNATFTSPMTAQNGSQEPFSTGQITLLGNSSNEFGNRTTLDAAMRQGLIPPLYAAKLELQRVDTVNNCEGVGLFSKALGRTAQNVGTFASGAGLWVLNKGYQSVLCKHCTLYVRQAEFSRQVYLKTMQSVTFPPVKDILSPLFEDTPVVQQAATWIKPYETLINELSGPTIYMYQATVRSTSDPDDPLLQWMRAQGLLMPPRFCNGTLLPPELANAKVDPMAPAWIVANTPQLQAALAEAAPFTSRPAATWRPPPEIVLSSDASLPTQPVLTFATAALITGPFNDDPDYQLTVRLDLRNTNNTLRLVSGAQLFIQQLVLAGLAQRPLPTAPNISSALPFAAIIPPPGTDPITGVPHVWLHNVTLVLPPDDYLALASLALADTPNDLSRCLDAGLTARTAQLRPGTQAISTTAVSSDLQWLHLSSFIGWGMNATDLRLVPSSPVPQFNDCKGAVNARQCSSLSCRSLVGIILGSALGCASLLAGALLLTRKPWAKANTSVPGHMAVCVGQPVSGQLPSKLEPPSKLATRVRDIELSAGQPSSELLNTDQTGDSWNPKAAVKQLSEQLIGTESHHLVLLRVLGSGTFGNVYHGTWRGLQVAVKTVVFEDALNDDQHTPEGAPGKGARAIMEAAIAASVGHRNVVSTYCHDIKAVQESHVHLEGGLKVEMGGGHGGRQPQLYKLFLVQELCAISLKVAMDHQFFSPVSDQGSQAAILLVLRDIASGLTYLHSRSIVHGDLKPDNILLKADAMCAEQVVAKLSDFGLSTHLAGNASHVSNIRCGTPFYVAPEVIITGRASLAADMFSFGVVMWQCLSSQQPYITLPGGEFTWNPVFPELGGPPFFAWDACRRLVHQCLQHDHKLRPSAAAALSTLESIYTSMLE